MTTNWDEWETTIGWILDTVPEARVVVDRRGRIVFVNCPTEAVLGYRGEELVGQPIEVLVPERHRGAHSGNRAGFTAQPRPGPMGTGLELFARRKDGSEFSVAISLWPLEREDGLFILAAIRDMTETRGRKRSWFGNTASWSRPSANWNRRWPS